MSDKKQPTITTAVIRRIPWKKLLFIILGAAICSFGIHNIHQRADITEGGIIGLMLLTEHWLGISPAYITPVLDIICYLLAFKYLGGKFIIMSILSTFSVSAFYSLWELFPPMLPDLSAYPLLAAISGGIFVGLGVGIIIRQGGSSGGDDALALTISRITHCRLSRAYLFTDFVVLGLSLTYIHFSKLVFSVFTVIISSFLIDRIQEFQLPDWPKLLKHNTISPPNIKCHRIRRIIPGWKKKSGKRNREVC